jgi:hypothetical protein
MATKVEVKLRRMAYVCVNDGSCKHHQQNGDHQTQKQLVTFLTKLAHSVCVSASASVRDTYNVFDALTRKDVPTSVSLLHVHLREEPCVVPFLDNHKCHFGQIILLQRLTGLGAEKGNTVNTLKEDGNRFEQAKTMMN